MEIKIGKSAHSCCVCERAFEHEEELTSLVRVENRVLLREDYCRACWDAARQANSYSVWTPTFCDPKVVAEQPPEAFSPLRQVFYEAVESTENVELAVAYLAAQLLRRQKAFRLIKESEDPETDERVALFSDRIGNRLIEVRDPNLSHENLEEGRRALMARLAELEAPEPMEEGGQDGQSEVHENA